MYFLGIDAGGSKCRARLTDASGHVIGHGLSGPANVRIGVPKVFAAIVDAYSQATKQAKLDAQAIASIHAGIGIAGIGREGAKEELQAQPFPFHTIKINSDGYIANMGAHSGRDGGIVVIGTGSIAVGREAGKDIQIGGYGFPISDEGSGAYIGLQAIRMTLRASDGRIAHSSLTDDFLQKFNNETRSIVGWMDKANATDYASLAPLVVQAAEAGDEVGRVILEKAASHIEMMVQGLLQAGVPHCALTGGLSKSLEPWLSSEIQAKLVMPDGDALDGALWLARHSAE